MKKTLLSLVTLISLTAFSQSLTINPSAYYYVETGEQAVAHFDVTNNSDTELEVIVTRSYDESYDIMSTFCWGVVCYPPTVNVSVVSIFITAGETFGGFTGYINDMPEEATYMINYCFSVVGNPTDAVCADIVFTSMSVLGCLDPLAYNYNPEATVDDSGSCIYQDCSISIQEENIPLYLPDGWSMFGYTCLEPLDLSLGFESVVDRVAIVKDFVGSAYLPEWNFNGIGDLIYSRGYQIKTTEEITDFSFCPTLIGTELVSNPQHQVGDIVEGGIVFYVDETGQHCLVAAQEDLEGTYEWGCYQEDVDGADSQWIGSGLQNTMDITNQGCATQNGGITAAQAALDAEINVYSDWYLPSQGELYLMYITIGQGADNAGGFANDYYWSSSEYSNHHAWYVYFGDGDTGSYVKKGTCRVRVIRAF